LVTRVSLVDRLWASTARVVAVVAPLGYGKTTLLAQWSARTHRRSAWISLDERDNDPDVLLQYVAAALDRLELTDPALGRSMPSPADVDPARMLRRLVGTMGDMGEPFALVLDHVEVIQDQRCCDAIAELALNVPPGSTLALASRTELPIPIGDLRAQGVVIEVGVDDLAMERDEAAELVAAADVVLSADDLTDLVHQTEGWPVGLYLATLAANANGARPPFGVAFRGDDRVMADYLRAEVLAHMSPAMTAFLTRTSVLDQLCGPLCDAVLAAHGSQETLESLASTILLLVPLDDQWFRCHRLLRDLLRVNLARTEPELASRLHDRAAAWFEANDRPDLAIEHAQAAGDADRAARLITGVAQFTNAAGWGETTRRWLGWFEARGMIERYPHVAVIGAVVEARLGHPTSAERWAAAATSGSFDGPLPDGSPLDSWVALLEAILCRRGVAGMRADAEAALARLAPGSPWCGSALFLVAMSRLLDGDGIDAIDPVFGRAVEVSVATSSLPTAAAALAERAVLAIERHDWSAGAAFASDAVAIVRDADLDALLQSTLVYAVAARVAVHEGEIATAMEHVVRASRLRPLCSAAAPFSAQFLLQLSHAYHELEDPAGARAVLRQIRDILQVRPDVGMVVTRAEELQHLVDTIRVGPVGVSSLTAAELRVLPLLATHLSYGEIAERLIVSRNTVKTHAVSIFRKLGVSSRSEAIEHAEEIGLLSR
jgi:LuxR family transcriptional regulator, maltose regulon positive regulatory protein